MRALAKVLSALVFFSACGEEPVPRMEPPPIEPARVDNPPAFDVEMSCFDVAEGETVGGTSSEGDLWLHGAEQVRSIRIEGTETQFAHELPSPLIALAPHSDSQGIAVSEEGFWRLDPEGPSFLYVPESLRGVTHFCGDPEIDGQTALVTPEGLFERQAGEWFMVSPSEDMNFVNVDWLSQLDGACHGRLTGLWFSTRTGTTPDKLYRVDGTSVATYDAPEGMSGEPATSAEMIAVPTGDSLLIAGELGPLVTGWAEIEFPAGDVDAVAIAGGILWVAVGTHLYRYADDVWTEATAPLESSVSRMWAHSAGGLWMEIGDQVCHVGPASTVRLRGIRPFHFFFSPTVDITVDFPGGDTVGNVSFSIDGGTPRSAALDESGHWVFDDLMLGRPGWHDFEVFVDDRPTRNGTYRIVAGDVSFSRDIEPISEEFCATAACHGGTEEAESIPLTTYDDWVEAAFQINERVSRGTMPKDAPDDWLPSQATTIVDWIQGGRQP